MSIPEPIFVSAPGPEMTPEIASMFEPVSKVGLAFSTIEFWSAIPLASNWKIVPGCMVTPPEPRAPFAPIPSVPLSMSVPPA